MSLFQKLYGGQIDFDVLDLLHQLGVRLQERTDPAHLQQTQTGNLVTLFCNADKYLRGNRTQSGVAQTAERLYGDIPLLAGGIDRLEIDLKEIFLQSSLQEMLDFLCVAEAFQRF